MKSYNGLRAVFAFLIGILFRYFISLFHDSDFMTHASAFPPPSRSGARRLQRVTLTPLMLWVFPIFMLLSIAAVFGFGARGTWISAFLLVLAVMVCSLRGQWLGASGFYFTYAALEGMYKYTTGFSNAIYVLKPLLVMMMALIWWLNAREKGRRLFWPPLTPLIVCLGCIGLVQSFHPFGGGFMVSIATLFLWYLAPIFLYFLLFNEVKTAVQMRQVLFFLLGIASLVSLFGVFQFGIGQQWLEEHLAGYARVAMGSATWFATDESGVRVTSFRPVSTTPHPGAAATWSFIGIMLSCGYVLEANVEKWKRALMVVLLFINAVGLLVTAVRLFVFISIICIALLMFFTARSARQVARNLLILALFSGIAWGGFWLGEIFSGGILSVRYASTMADPVGKFQKDRGQNFTFLPYFLPLYPMGIGFQRGVGDRKALGPKTEDSIFLGDDRMVFNRETQFNSTTADLGLPGLLFLCALMGYILQLGWRTQRTLQGSSQSMAALVFSILIGHMISFFGGPLLQGADYFWLLLALLTILPKLGPISWQNSSK